MRVGLIGPPEREELVRLAIRLEERDVQAVVLDPRAEPAIELAAERESACGVELGKLAAFYVADLGLLPPRAASEGPPSREESERRLAASRTRLVLWHTLLARLAGRGARIVNPPATFALHGLKPFEMAEYRRLGAPAPRTLATSSAAALLALADDAGPYITKGLVGGYGYTEAFEPPATLEDARALLEQGPRMVQQKIEGENVRAFVAGGELVGAAEILPSDPGEVDSRKETGRVRRVRLPEEAARAALAATRHFGLLFSAVDFMREAASGRYFLLECNSSPFFVELERRTGVDVSSALADLLTGRRDRPGAGLVQISLGGTG